MRFAVLFLLVFGLLAGCSSTSPITEGKAQSRSVPDLNGSWEVDYTLSENPNDKLKYLYEVTRSHLSQQVRRDDNPARAIAAMADLQGLIDLGRLTDLIVRPNVLTILQSGNEVVVEREGDYALTCDLATRELTGNVLGIERCGWYGKDLVFEVALPDGLYVRHRLVLSDNGKRLSVATTVASEEVSQAFTVNRVYMPFEPGGGQFECEQTVARGKTCTLGTSE